ncbi:MAG: HAD family hydrolase [Betaproteobacteria bacterium]|nr:HAD-IB family hydrolase [Burkholderiales bacterium]NBX89308.1 HAD family hydrolase [Betaproteobacteria bacterium]
MRLALFDLDHTLLNGDSDQLWCDFLIEKGMLEKASFSQRNAQIASDYQSGTVDVQVFCDFYIGSLVLKSPQDWQPLRVEFLHEWIAPRLAAAGKVQIQMHQAQGDRVVMTTATNRFITELTAEHLGVSDLIATETEIQNGLFTGHATGVPNMREGKVKRLHAWLSAQGLDLSTIETWGYSDSMNDLPLLEAVNHPTVTQGDTRLRTLAQARGWPLVDWF